MNQVKFLPRKSVAEIYSTGMEYCFTDENGQGIVPPVRCKDFFQDMFWAEHTNQTVSIYGFKWEPQGKLLNEETLYLAVRNNDVSDKEIGKYASNVQRLLNDIEKANNVELSTVYSTNDNTVISVAFNKWWVSRPYLLSAITLLIRSGIDYTDDTPKEFLERCSKTGSNLIGKHDSRYITSAMKNLTPLINGEVFDQSWNTYKTTSDIHNRSGVVSFSNTVAKAAVPQS